MPDERKLSCKIISTQSGKELCITLIFQKRSSDITENLQPFENLISSLFHIK
jgi:hypothetical protein